MRPGPIGPGNIVERIDEVHALAGFNEARPNWAGKFGRSQPGEVVPFRFNEARPNWAGKSGAEPSVPRRYSWLQ